jgi:rhodanese-related sulfurtransferase
MARMNSRFALFLHVSFAAGLLLNAATAHAEGNRYKYPRAYKADISPVVAQRAVNEERGTVLIDVRSLEEYAGGHAPKADNIPYPRVTGKNKDDPSYKTMSEAEFLAEIVARYPKKSTPIITMCQSGGRSVLAANILAKAGYTDVRSVWSGYLGKTLTDTDNNPLDVNANGIISGVTLGADGKPIEDPGDMDGWAGYNDLPVTDKIEKKRVLPQFYGLYGTVRAAK